MLGITMFQQFLNIVFSTAVYNTQRGSRLLNCYIDYTLNIYTLMCVVFGSIATHSGGSVVRGYKIGKSYSFLLSIDTYN